MRKTELKRDVLRRLAELTAEEVDDVVLTYVGHVISGKGGLLQDCEGLEKVLPFWGGAFGYYLFRERNTFFYGFHSSGSSPFASRALECLAYSVASDDDDLFVEAVAVCAVAAYASGREGATTPPPATMTASGLPASPGRHHVRCGTYVPETPEDAVEVGFFYSVDDGCWLVERGDEFTVDDFEVAVTGDGVFVCPDCGESFNPEGICCGCGLKVHDFAGLRGRYGKD